MGEEVDKSIIKGLVRYEGIDFNDLGWIKCNLHNADMGDFERQGLFEKRDLYDKAIRENDEFLLLFLIIYSFERGGFDFKLAKCNRRCEWYKKGEKIKTHPVSVLSALNGIKRQWGADDVGELLECEKIETLAGNWFNKTIEVYKKKFSPKKFNTKGFNDRHLMSFLKFFKDGKIRELRIAISKNRFGNAHSLLNEIEGIGPKVAKFIIRDLAFSLTEWGKKEKLDSRAPKDVEVLKYAIPIDRWVRRVSISIPTIGNRVKNSLEISDLVDEGISEKINEKLGLTIAELCREMKLNPMRFDFGAYLFGVNEIERKIHTDEIYSKLKERLITKCS